MAKIAVYASRILTPQEEIRDGVIVVEGTSIVAGGHRDEIHVPSDAADYVASGSTVVPGFVDVHIHGAGGHDVMEASALALGRITSTVARHGTTSILATTVSAPVEQTCQCLERIARYVKSRQSDQENGRLAAEIVGIHLEGPFISEAKRGVHLRDSLASPSVETLERFLKAADGLVRILTLAPEL